MLKKSLFSYFWETEPKLEIIKFLTIDQGKKVKND